MKFPYKFLQTLARAPTRTARYGLVVVIVGLTLFVGLFLYQTFGEPPSIILFIVPVALSGWYGGLRSGLLATLLGGLGYSYFLLDPPGSLFAHTATDWER